MDFGCYYCHSLRDSFSDVVKHSSSVHELEKLKIRSRELNVITGKIGYRTHNFNIIPNEIKVNRQKNVVKCGEPGNLSIRISGHHNEDVSILKSPLSKKFKFSEHSDLNELQTSCDNSGTFLKDDNLNVDDQTLPELEFEVNDDDTNREILISQIPQVMQAMKDIGQLDTRIKFNDMIINETENRKYIESKNRLHIGIKMATVVLDNGAGLAKVGLSTHKAPRVMPNCVTKARSVRTRTFIGDQIDDCKDLSGLYYLLPSQKGYLVNWEIQRQIWDYMFGKDCLKVDYQDSNIIVTEPYFNFSSAQEAMNEIFFEEYQFNSVFRCNPSFLSQYKYSKEKDQKPLCSVVVDIGYSFTHIIPYCKGRKLTENVKRIDIGGKVLTNHLKEVISYRQLMVMDETYVINQLKEDVCYVSQNFMKDMEIARKKGKDNTIARDYVLPDYTHIKRGLVRSLEETTGKAKDGEQIIRMNNERFVIPELLFHPSDVGIHEMGVAEALVYAVQSLPEEMQPHMFSNVILTGGNCRIPGFYERMKNDTRSMTPEEFDLCMTTSENPSVYAWEGGTMFAKDPQMKKLAVTKEDYDENGHNICFEKFDV